MSLGSSLPLISQVFLENGLSVFGDLVNTGMASISTGGIFSGSLSDRGAIHLGSTVSLFGEDALQQWCAYRPFYEASRLFFICAQQFCL